MRLKLVFSQYIALFSLLILGIYAFSFIENEELCASDSKNLTYITNNSDIRYNPDYPTLLQIFKYKDMETPEGWNQVDIDKNGKPDFYQSDSTGFEATSFVNGEILLVVFRGMHIQQSIDFNLFSGKDGENALDIFIGNIGLPFIGNVPRQFYDAIAYYEMMEKQFPSHKIVIVGKSLGGALAELVGAIKGAETYTFAAPGASYALKKLDKKYQASIKKNSLNNFNYIKNYCNLNDPCGNYGEHIGLRFVYPPMPVREMPFYDIHGNITHFMNEDAFKHIIPIPKNWKYKYTAALLYFDRNLKENMKPISMHDILKIRYRVCKKDLDEALNILNTSFHSFTPCNTNKEQKKEVVSNYKSNSY